ncbi:MAG: carboxylating nicotinate-nucleotide diphosphorylase [Alphaproteobacteria bacterium]|jgi:nicotinate-nucleotide pyrophosphorylase (carboxylating)|nr:carboxylating nicotinate-nucleotide diphosphorylase [Alphaproteobacteria bacterium]
MTDLTPPPAFLIEPLLRAALAEDLGRAGDITSAAVLPPGLRARAVMRARESGRLAGIEAGLMAFRLIDPDMCCHIRKGDGADIAKDEIVAEIAGDARGILTAERTALNLACHLSGVASATARLVAAVRPHPTRIVCTRKTTPGLRILEKYAVRLGGGANHRFGLDDGMLIKDNHVAMAGGIRPALARARAAAGHMVKVEIEVDTLDQLAEALAAGADAVLLDNMTIPMLAEAVVMARGRAATEASGRINLDTVAAVAATGVDLISSGAITHSAPILDLGLDID